MSLLLLVSLLFSENSPEDLAKKFSTLFEKTCSKCHEIKDLDKTTILERIQPGGGMPKGKPPLNKEEMQLVANWVKAGGPVVEVKNKNKVSEFDIFYPLEIEIIRTIYNDLRNLPEEEAKDTRYLTLTHLWLAGATNEELEVYRQAIQKLVNSLSWNKELIKLIPIDKKKTIYRVPLSKLTWTTKNWDTIIKDYPYQISYPDEIANLFYKNYSYGHKTVYVRADWFVFAASRPPLYHDFIFYDPNSKDAAFVNALKQGLFDPKDKDFVRAAIKKSGVSKNNRIIERKPTIYGAYWQSYDFDGNSDKKDIFKNPINFSHAGGEVIFNLPNGLQAYILTNAKGDKLSEAPIDIVRDSSRPDGKIINGISCMSCHLDGMHAKYDDLLPVVDKFPDNYKNDIDKIRGLYKTKEELKKYFTDDQNRYKDSLAKLSVPTQINGKEQVRIVSDKFEEDLDLKTAASELGISIEALKALSKNNKELDQIVFRLEHGGIARDTFIAEFRKLSDEILSKREKQLFTTVPYVPKNKILYDVQYDLVPRKLMPIAPLIMSDGETALVTSRAGQLSWIKEGKIIHQEKLKDAVELEPVIYQEKIVVATKDGTMEVFDWDEKLNKAKLVGTMKLEGMPSHNLVYMGDSYTVYSSYDDKKNESTLHPMHPAFKMNSISLGDSKVLSIKKISNDKVIVLTSKKLTLLELRKFQLEVVASFEFEENTKAKIVFLKDGEIVLSAGKKVFWLREKDKKIEELAHFATKNENILISETHNGEYIFLKDKGEIALVKRVEEKIEKVDSVAGENTEYYQVALMRDYKHNGESAPAFLLQERAALNNFRVFTFKMKSTDLIKITPDIGKTSEVVHFRGGDVNMISESYISRPVTFKGRESFIVTSSGGYAYVLK